ncbi:hypothetical protein K1T71_004608 [Dendrolimus kikuchii]|uniref:Uncharacterized protein n=1 Tax=Dendrolimus kikuchii TaxID=765133 RepID=A0ACC1D824_9NEOP|nr:hypothetical protein K1T71_004608 [Dendrolimus kikuchii]
MEQNKEQSSFVQSVRVKVPPFWPDEPALWFTQLEGQFALANITVDSTKYNYVISNLEFKYAAEIKDIINKPPDSNKYDKVKKELINRLSSSQEQKVRQLLTHEDMGDRKPSQFLRHLQNLAGPNVPDDFVRSLWSSRLPTHIQIIVASQSSSNLEELATVADNVNDVIGQQQVHQISTPTTSTDIDDLKKSIAELTNQVAQLSSPTRTRPRWQSNNRQKWRPRSRRQSEGAATDAHCWYHRIFREKATKCRPPCAYTSEN